MINFPSLPDLFFCFTYSQTHIHLFCSSFLAFAGSTSLPPEFSFLLSEELEPKISLVKSLTSFFMTPEIEFTWREGMSLGRKYVSTGECYIHETRRDGKLLFRWECQKSITNEQPLVRLLKSQSNCCDWALRHECTVNNRKDWIRGGQ